MSSRDPFLVALLDAWKRPASISEITSRNPETTILLLLLYMWLIPNGVTLCLIVRAILDIEGHQLSLVANFLRRSLEAIPTRRAPKVPILPFEIWGMIFDQALATPYSLDTSCTPRAFHLLVRRHRHSDWRKKDKLQALTTYNALILVCRSWNEILATRPAPWIEIKTSRAQMFVGHATRRLEYDALYSHKSRTERYNTQLTEDSSLSSVNIIGIKAWCDVDQDQVLQETIFQRSKDLVNLQSLILEGFLVWDPTFRRIERHFSGIKVLSIASRNRVYGSITLIQLDTLILNANIVDIKEWRLPSLLHFSLGDMGIGFQTTFYDPSTFPVPVAQLQSLFLSFNAYYVADAGFWTTHSSLRTLCVLVPRFKFTGTVPPSHPIEHLFLGEGVRPTFSRTLQSHTAEPSISWALSNLPNLQYLSIHCSTTFNKDESQKCERPFWKQHFLERSTRRNGRGMIWLDEEGDEIIERWHWKERIIRRWEIHAVFMIYGIWTLDLFWGLYDILSFSRRTGKISATPSLLAWGLYHSWAVFDHYMS